MKKIQIGIKNEDGRYTIINIDGKIFKNKKRDNPNFVDRRGLEDKKIVTSTQIQPQNYTHVYAKPKTGIQQSHFLIFAICLLILAFICLRLKARLGMIQTN